MDNLRHLERCSPEKEPKQLQKNAKVRLEGLRSLDGGLLTALVEVEAGKARALFAGAGFGVFWTVDQGSGFGPWSEFGGASLPNAVVGDLDYDPIDDVLVVGTIGRGAWEVPAISTYLTIPEPATATLSSITAVGLLAGFGRVGRARKGWPNSFKAS